jgi:hypothetical protein
MSARAKHRTVDVAMSYPRRRALLFFFDFVALAAGGVLISFFSASSKLSGHNETGLAFGMGAISSSRLYSAVDGKNKMRGAGDGRPHPKSSGGEFRHACNLLAGIQAGRRGWSQSRPWIPLKTAVMTSLEFAQRFSAKTGFETAPVEERASSTRAALLLNSEKG